MQADGNFVQFDGRGGLFNAWGTNTTVNAYVRLQVDGNLVVYNSAGAVIRATNVMATC